MANPKKKHTRMRTDLRRSANWKLASPNLSKCSHCGMSMISHHICPECGFYNGDLILPKKVKKKQEGEQPPQG